jgi:PhnB protein
MKPGVPLSDREEIPMKIEPYLNFDGRCEEAFKFYEQAVGAKAEMVLRFSDSPEPCPEGMIAPGSENKIMHMSMLIAGTRILASDCSCAGTTTFSGVSLAYSVDAEADADKVFNALAEGGKVEMPLGKTFFSPRFGTLVDKFGLAWTIVTEQKM